MSSGWMKSSPFCADRLVDRDAEEALGGAVGPPDLGARVDHEDGVGQRAGAIAARAASVARGHLVRVPTPPRRRPSPLFIGPEPARD